MNKQTFLTLILVAGLAPSALAAGPSATTTDAAAILRTVDRLRIPVQEGSMRADVTQQTGSGVFPAIAFGVSFAADGARRIETLGGPRKGQKVLLTDEGYWIFMPGTKNPVRLTQLQRLLGQASFGDVGRLRFAEDYDLKGERSLADGGRELRLSARDRSSAYRDVLLTVDAAGTRPLSAVFLYPSGKVFKQVLFAAPVEESGHEMVATMTFIDPVDPARKATVTYSRIAEKDIPDALFTPASLKPED